MVWIERRRTAASADGVECLIHHEPRGDGRHRLSGRPGGGLKDEMSDLKKHAERIIRTLREHDHQAYLVGGCVRDLLLEREPDDYDVATDATADEVMRIFPEAYAVGAQFGVVLVPLILQKETLRATSLQAGHS